MHIVSNFSQSGGQTTNEDALLCVRHPHDESISICALADGQGGRHGGQEAARLACAVAVEKASSYSPKQLTNPKRWIKILREADRAVRQDEVAGFTTLVGLCVAAHTVCGASNGDSAAVLLNVYDRFHVLTDAQQKNPPIGSGKAIITPFAEGLIDPWQVVLCTDGLWKYVGWSEVATLVKRHRGQALVDEATAAAKMAGNGVLRDDTSVLVVTDGAAN